MRGEERGTRERSLVFKHNRNVHNLLFPECPLQYVSSSEPVPVEPHVLHVYSLEQGTVFGVALAVCYVTHQLI